jgi:hypothetical protein
MEHPMPTTDRILDWATISAAGIDTNRVSRDQNPQDTSLELYSIPSNTESGVRLVFGEYYDRTEGGWDSLVYERVAEGDWQPMGAPDWYETPADLLAAVKAWADGN